MAPSLVLLMFLALCQNGMIVTSSGWNISRSLQTEYKLFANESSYFEAQRKCDEENASLVSICSAKEQRTIVLIVGKRTIETGIWIGYYCKSDQEQCNKTEEWTWPNGQQCNYTNWKTGQPRKRKYAYLNIAFEWLSSGDTYNKPFICKRARHALGSTKQKSVTTVTGTYGIVTDAQGEATTEEHAELYLDILNETETIMPGNKTSLETKMISGKLRNTLQQDVATSKLTPRNLNTSLEAVFSLSRIDFDPAGSDPDVAKDTLINLAFSADHLLSLNNIDSWQELLQKDETGAVKIASVTDNIGRGIARMLPMGSTKNISLDNFAIQAVSLPKNLTTAVYFNEDEHEGPPRWNVDYSSTKSSIPIDSIEVKSETLKEFAKNTGTENLVMWATYHMTLDRLMPSANMTINSRIRALTVEDLESGFTFHPSITLLLRPLNSTLFGEEQILCSFWNYTSASSGYWSQEGCSLKTTDDNQTTCECNHLTNFAILVSPHVAEGLHAKVLGHISLIGCILSILGCFATTVSYALAWKEAKSQHAIVYLNLCTVLIIANVLFLTGIEKVQNKLACTLVAVLLHYFWLVAFMSMLADGVMLILNVIYVFHVKRFRETLLLLVIAWLFPAVVVGITLGMIGTEGYGTEEYCWLERSNSLYAAFIAPMAAIIVANSAVFVKVLHIAATSKSNQLKERSQVRAVIWNIMVILPLLGVGWIFGLLSVNEETVIFQYVFAIANSLQGFFIFIFHCVLNKKVRQGISSRMGNPSTTSGSQATRREMLKLVWRKNDNFAGTSF